MSSVYNLFIWAALIIERLVVYKRITERAALIAQVINTFVLLAVPIYLVEVTDASPGMHSSVLSQTNMFVSYRVGCIGTGNSVVDEVGIVCFLKQRIQNCSDCGQPILYVSYKYLCGSHFHRGKAKRQRLSHYLPQQPHSRKYHINHTNNYYSFID